MKEAPIIMSGNHPKLILDGIETMTRRVIKPQPRQRGRQFNINYYDSPKIGITEEAAVPQTWLEYGCPYGQVGDRLWVRETCKRFTGIPIKNIAWANNTTWTCAPDKDPFHSLLPIAGNERDIEDLDYHAACVTVPSIHMPRWASRITLEITEVRVERVTKISEDDAEKEGMNSPDVWNHYLPHYEKGERYVGVGSFVNMFRIVWDSLNAKRGYGWDVNPWVWVLSFKLQEQPK